MKLFILNDISAFSSDTVFKICLTLEEKGLAEENIERFASYDDLLEALVPSLEEGEHIIVAAENNDYNLVKRALIGRLGSAEISSSEIAEAIAKNAGDSLAELDVSGHSLIMQGALPLISEDGLYSGFSAQAFSGRVSCLPLDFMRIDKLIDTLSSSVIGREEQLQQQGVESGEIIMPDFDLEPAVSEMVKALSDEEKSIALATGEAAMWVYNLYDKIDYLTDTVKFIEINDEYPDETSTAESESAVVIRHAKEAMLSVGTDFGGAVSDIYSTENAEGETVYFAYAAFVDGETAKAKKINISDPENLGIILPHALTLLCDMVVKKLEAEKRRNAPAAPAKPESKKPDKKMIAIAAAVILVALIAPIIIVFGFLNDDNPTTQPSTGDVNVINPDTGNSQTFPSTSDPFGGTTLGGVVNIAPEPSAADVSATQTTAPQPSTKGIFTFYVFGYGHGVGMSQTGANYLASQGWTWAQILAHYYYDGNTAIVTGDPYPQKITYAGTEYETREYLARAVESEMGASFHKEALKAQCVAIYNFAKHYSYNVSKDAHAFSTSTPSQTIYTVVDEVMENGYYITHNGGIALTPFHAMSAGITTSYYNVWGNTGGTTVPYLAGGRKSYGDYLDEDFKSVYSISSDDFKALVEGNADLGVTLSGDPSTWLTIVTHDQAVRSDIGYVSTINVGGKVITGYDFRIKVMGGRIRSHCFALVYTPTA